MIKKDWTRKYVCLGITEDQQFRIADVSYPVDSAVVDYEDMRRINTEKFLKNFDVLNLSKKSYNLQLNDSSCPYEIDYTGGGIEMPQIAIAKTDDKFITVDFDGNIHRYNTNDCFDLVVEGKIINLKIRQYKKSAKLVSVYFKLIDLSELKQPRDIIDVIQKRVGKANLLGAGAVLENEVVLKKIGKTSDYVYIPGVPIIDTQAIDENGVSRIVFNEGIEIINSYAIRLNFADGVEKNVTLPESLISIAKNGLVFDIDNIYIGANLKDVNIKELRVYEGFDVSEENKIYSSYDGCLYSKNHEELLYIPYSKTSVKVHHNCKNIGNVLSKRWGCWNNIDLSEVELETIGTKQFSLALTGGLKLNSVKVERNAFSDCHAFYIDFTNNKEMLVDAAAFEDAHINKINLHNFRLVKDIGIPGRPVIIETEQFDGITFEQLQALSTDNRTDTIKRNMIECIYRFYTDKEKNPEYYEICNSILSRAAARFDGQCGRNLFYRFFEAYRCVLSNGKHRPDEVAYSSIKKDIDCFLEKMGCSYEESIEAYCKEFEEIYNRELEKLATRDIDKFCCSQGEMQKLRKLYKETIETIISEYVDSGEYAVAINGMK